MKRIFRNLAFITLGVALTIPAIATPLLLANKSKGAVYDDTIIMPSELYLNAKGQNILASTITKQNANEYIAGIPTDDSYNFVEIQDIRLPNDQPDGGSIFITLKLSRKNNKNLYKTQTYLVDGFMYESENKFKNTKLTSTGLAKTILPSELASPEVPQSEIEKYVKNFPNFTNENAQISIEFKVADDTKGTLTLSLLYKKNSRVAKIQETITGFKSLGQVWEEEIDKEFLKFNFQAKPSAINILPSNIKTKQALINYVKGFDSVILENDVKEEITNIISDNENGTISFDLILSKGNVSKTKTYTVNGFKTTRMQDEQDVQDIYDSLIQYQARTSQAAGLKYPDIVNADNISTYIINLPKKPTNGVKLEYVNFTSNNQNGELGFDIKISKSNIEKIIPQRSIFGFFSDNTIAYVLDGFKKTITKKSPDDFVHRTDPSIVNIGNFRSYFNYNTSNRYNINLTLENVEFIPIQTLAHFRLSFRATHSSGLNRIITIDWPLGSLYLSGLYLALLSPFSNANQSFDNSSWAGYNWYSLLNTSRPPIGGSLFEGNNNKLSIVATPGSGNIGMDLYIRKAGNDKFKKLIRDTKNLLNMNEFATSISNFQYGNVPYNLTNPIGTNIYPSSGSRIVTNPTNYNNEWIWWTIKDNQRGKANTSNLYFSFDTNGKYNFHWNHIKIYVDYYWL